MAKKWNQSKCPSSNEWENKILFLYVNDYHSATERNEEVLIYDIYMYAYKRISKTLCYMKEARHKTPHIM
jgi:hypothetical protein